MNLDPTTILHFWEQHSIFMYLNKKLLTKPKNKGICFVCFINQKKDYKTFVRTCANLILTYKGYERVYVFLFHFLSIICPPTLYLYMRKRRNWLIIFLNTKNRHITQYYLIISKKTTIESSNTAQRSLEKKWIIISKNL